MKGNPISLCHLLNLSWNPVSCCSSPSLINVCFTDSLVFKRILDKTINHLKQEVKKNRDQNRILRRNVLKTAMIMKEKKQDIHERSDFLSRSCFKVVQRRCYLVFLRSVRPEIIVTSVLFYMYPLSFLRHLLLSHPLFKVKSTGIISCFL